MKTKFKAGLFVALIGIFSLASCNVENTSKGSSNTDGGNTGGDTEGYSGAASYVTDAEAKAEILGQLEKYAMDTKLTGIPVLSDSSYSYYHKRINFPKDENGNNLGYVTGYGTGILMEGSIDTSVDFSTDAGEGAYRNYYHTIDSQVPTSINGMNGQDTRISGLYGYISSSFYGTRLVKADNYTAESPKYKNDFEWYSVLAKPTNKQKDGLPVAVTTDANGNKTVADDSKNTYSTWRIYVKTGETDELKYYMSDKASRYSTFNGTDVDIEDYIFAMKVLLNQKTGYYRSSSYTSGTGEIKGAASYYNKTKNIGPVAGSHTSSHELVDNDSSWNNVGYQPGYDASENAYFIDITFNVPCDQFNAMYQLSDSNIEPINPDFFGDVTNLDITTGYGKNGGAYKPKDYGAPTDTNGSGIINNIMSLGAYVLDEWNDSKRVVFKRNDNWFEYADTETAYYQIPGIYININTAAQQNQYYSVQRFTTDFGYTDATSRPGDTTQYDTKLNEIGVSLFVPGSSNWKLSVNACTQDMWNELFGANGTIKQEAKEPWKVKEIMSNADFLDGCFFAIDRETAATKAGMTPAYEYFSDAYYIDPVNKIVYNDTEAHQNAVSQYYPETYGYNKEAAKTMFKSAINTLLDNGSYKAGDTITLTALWMSDANIKQFGSTITGNIVDTFNESAKEVNSANPLTLVINNTVASNKGDVYTPIGEGKFDFAFGALSGMNYNPLGMMEVMKSDNSSGFTLNWGTDTAANDGESLIYAGKSWSFDALWNAAVYGVTVMDGKVTLPYIYNDKKSGFIPSDDLDSSGNFTSLEYQLTFDVNKELEDAANMEIDTFQVAITFYGEGTNIYSFVIDLVSELDDSDPDKDSKVVFTKTDETLTATLDLASVYYYSTITKKSDGTIDQDSIPSANETKAVINDIYQSVGRDLGMVAYYTVNMEFDGFASMATLSTKYSFKGALYTAE